MGLEEGGEVSALSRNGCEFDRWRRGFGFFFFSSFKPGKNRIQAIERGGGNFVFRLEEELHKSFEFD